MTIEEQLYTALQSLVAGRVFPDVAEQNTALPYITYQAVGGEPVNFLTGEKPGSTNVRMQVNVWAATRIGASTLGAQVENALRDTKSFQTEVLTGRVSTYDETDTVKYRGTMQDFSINY
jgi:hypothetical protein